MKTGNTMSELNRSVQETTVAAECPETFAPNSRRGFLAVLSGLIGAIVGLVPVIMGGLFFIGPVFKKKNGNLDYIDLNIKVDDLSDDGTPVFVPVVAEKVDAWNRIPNQQIGSVYLRKHGNDVLAFNTICPHLGCSVKFRSAEQDFFCPCHTSKFQLTGEKINEIPPRGMDQLEVKIDAGQIKVKYQNFRAGTPEKIPVS